jgi:hypothetical protein
MWQYQDRVREDGQNSATSGSKIIHIIDDEPDMVSVQTALLFKIMVILSIPVTKASEVLKDIELKCRQLEAE